MHIPFKKLIHILKKSWLITTPFVIAIAVVVTVYLTQNHNPETSKAASNYAYVRQTVYSIDGKTGWSRDCRLDANGPNFNQCTRWNGPTSLTTIRGVGNESYGAYSAFTFSKNNQQTIRQVLYSKDGTQSWNRDCPVYSWGVEFSDCTAWPTASPLSNLRGVGGEAYSGFSAFTYVVNGQTKLRHTVYSLDGKSGWFRECLIGVNGPEQCNPVWTGDVNNLTNARGVGNEAYGSFNGLVYSVNAQQILRQVLVTLAGNQAFFRTCPISLTDGIQFTGCSGWNDMNIASLRGVGGEAYGAYEEFIYTSQIDLLPQLTNYTPRSGTLTLGAGYSSKKLNDTPYKDAFLKYGYKSLTPENALKMAYTEPSQGSFSFTNGDIIVNFATANGLNVRGHTLVWHYQNPDWFNNGTFTRSQLIAILRDHIQTVVTHYKGKIKEWDVVNEAIDDNGNMRQTKWSQTIGPDYIDLAFRFAHEADPTAKLFYNDYNAEGLGVKSDAVYNLVKEMRNRKVPINGVGLQMHVKYNDYPSPQDISANISRLGALGLETNITEIDVQIGESPGTATKLQQQADTYKNIASACFQAQNCKTFTTWGLDDGTSWIPAAFGHPDAPLLLDANYLPKPAYWAITQYMGISLTPTSAPSCYIQGYKVLANGQPGEPAASQVVKIDGINPVTSNPFAFINVTPGNHTVSVTSPSGYSVGYTSCVNSTSCHQSQPLSGSSVTVNCPAGGYVDLFWHFTPPNTNTPTPTFTKTPTPTPSFTRTPTPSFTKTPTPTLTSTFAPTKTPTPTSTFTPIPTKTPTPTVTPIGATSSPTLTSTNTLTPTKTLTNTATVTVIAAIPGDANGDRKVDGIDYAIWLAHYGTIARGPSNGDFNNDGKVDGVDFVIWLNNYGRTG
jgi:endo-1,4-beta-xylanase